MRRPSGFYSSSLEMLLDTMCNVLGGVVFIALLVALVAREAAPSRAQDSETQAIELTNQLAAVTTSNAWVQTELDQVILRIQESPHKLQTNHMRLPNIAETSRSPWPIIVTNGELYPLFVLSPNRQKLFNERAIIDNRGTVLARPGAGQDPESAVSRMVAAFKQQRLATNFYFVFEVYEDSFPAFVRARSAAARLGFQYGWDPLVQNAKLILGTQPERILPQN